MNKITFALAISVIIITSCSTSQITVANSPEETAQTEIKTEVAASADFAAFKGRIAAL